MMRLALSAAERALGTTAPNPAVGAVLADEASSTVLAVAATAPGGRPHAEPQALALAGDAARGRTLYVTLEPCSHFGRTPPCADAVVAAGIGRVVVALEDPDPRVSGRGLRRLREAGIAVDRGLLSAQSRTLTRGHVVRVTERRPFIQIKIAVAADGRIAAGTGAAPVWVTGPVARAHGHLLRAGADAILVGTGTVAADDPELTCRLPGLAHRSPLRVVLAGRILPHAGAKLARTAARTPTLILAPAATLASEAELATSLAALGCRLVPVPTVAGVPWLPGVAEALVAEGVTRLLVEGGPRLWRAFAMHGLIDEVVVFVGGAQGPGAEAAAASALAYYLSGAPFVAADRRRLGADEMLVYATAKG
ncbi:MAG: bifunctional diaminohydroxyphosphoribosylaminopyrimidine deaminase/5-amino-6-(5-phosphoribosylamino)uracil reductase RibD [Hyphomicrobiaceae bacterium]|nr:bifunctional diaminohydroxyphosphoribosylaminopyrimidine deaminase/5-amino-6-(5-phosphoribosylamino)uracil reductase RibD [Hyphomicrobiaceae bacterium]